MTEPIYTTAQVAALLGVSDSRVRQIALTLGVGRKLSPRVRVFTAAEVERLRGRAGPGRPWPKTRKTPRDHGDPWGRER